jgi:hypothetical protein
MPRSDSSRALLSLCVAATLLAGCGASQPTIPGAGVAPQSRAKGASSASCPTAACIYVANEAGRGSITVYPANATGNVPPYREITGLTNPGGVAVDSLGDVYASFAECFVIGCIPAPSILVFSATANGDAKPLRTIFGPATHLGYPLGIAVDANNDIYAKNTHTIEKHCYVSGHLGGCLQREYVTVYKPSSQGNVPPIRTVRGRKTRMFSQNGGTTVDGLGNLYVVSERMRIGRQRWGEPEILVYKPGAHGDIAPSWTIGGSKTGLKSPAGVGVDGIGNVYVTDSQRVFVYAAGAHGNVAPVQTISGSNTELNDPISVAVAEGNIYILNAAFASIQNASITVYAAGASGNVAPIQTIEGSETGLSLPGQIVVH